MAGPPSGRPALPSTIMGSSRVRFAHANTPSVLSTSLASSTSGPSQRAPTQQRPQPSRPSETDDHPNSNNLPYSDTTGLLRESRDTSPLFVSDRISQPGSVPHQMSRPTWRGEQNLGRNGRNPGSHPHAATSQNRRQHTERTGYARFLPLPQEEITVQGETVPTARGWIANQREAIGAPLPTTRPQPSATETVNQSTAQAKDKQTIPTTPTSTPKPKLEEAKKTEKPSDQPQKLNETNCPICMDLPTHLTVTPCGHIFCRDCLNQAIQVSQSVSRNNDANPASRHMGSCPVCRTKIDPSRSIKRENRLVPILLMKKSAYKLPPGVTSTSTLISSSPASASKRSGAAARKRSAPDDGMPKGTPPKKSRPSSTHSSTLML